ncbi:MAG TPA: ATP cone domain-containing protein, partial [Azonexus sp.]|nr:ATP cone domain-containing protein [Azonexus sp.]
MPSNIQSLAAANEFAVAALQVIRRNGALVAFDADKIAVALTKAFLAVEGSQSAVSSRVREVVARLTQTVVRSLTRRSPDGGTVHIEDIQDQVELALMRAGEHDVARAYVLYRERRAAERAASHVDEGSVAELHVLDAGVRQPLDRALLLKNCEAACIGLGDLVSASTIFEHALKNLYDGVPLADVYQALILAARTLIEREPAYNQVTARLLLASVGREVLGRPVTLDELATVTADYLPVFVKQGIAAELHDPRLATYDLPRLAA